MDIKIWLLYLMTDFLLDVIPGPAVILVSSIGFAYGYKNSCFGALGLILGEALYFLLSALGLGTIILAVSNLFNLIKFGGAIYLIVVGLIMILNSFKKTSKLKANKIVSINRSRLFIKGFITQISNPKAIIFFIALLPQFIRPEGNVSLQFFILGLTTIVSDGLVLAAYGWISDKGKNLIKQNTIYTKIQERLSGLVLVGIGINLLFMRTKK